MANIIRKGERERERGGLARSWNDPFDWMRSMLGWDPFREMQSYEGFGASAWNPDVEVKETKDAYVFKADLPGIQDKDLEISVTGNQISISGKREEERKEEEEEGRYYVAERSYGSFTRSFTLPQGADAESVTADLKDGVLTLNVPKRPEVQARKISVGGGGGEKKQLEKESGGKETSGKKAA